MGDIDKAAVPGSRGAGEPERRSVASQVITNIEWVMISVHVAALRDFKNAGASL